MNELQELIGKSGLDPVKSNYLLTEFSDYQKISEYWKQSAAKIIVTSGTQIEDIKAARDGRLILRDKRIAIEKRRKELKEQSLREGKAIDAVAKYLTGLIEPIEKYLDDQEHFTENQIKEQIRQQVEKKRLEDEAAAAALKQKEEEENRKARAENDRLRQEVEAQKKQIAEAERIKAENELLRTQKEAAEKALSEKTEKEMAEIEQQIFSPQPEKASVQNPLAGMVEIRTVCVCEKCGNKH